MRALALCLIAFTVGCGGGDDGPRTSPTPVNPPFNQTMTGTVSSFGTVRHPLTIPRAGNMSLRLTWTDPVVDLDLYLAPVGCTTLHPLSSCGVLAASDAATGTQESIARTVNNGESYQIWVDNLNLTRPQSYTLTLTIQ